MPAARGAAGIDIQQFRGDIVDALGGLAPCTLPLVAAELVQRCILGRRTGVAADQFQRPDRYIQLVATGIAQRQVFILDVADLQCLEAQVASDTVLFMHDRCIDLQVVQVAHDAGRVTRRPAASCLACAVAEQQVFGYHREGGVVQQEAVFQRRHANGQGGCAVQEFRPALDRLRMQPETRQLLAQCFAAPGRVRRDQDAAGEAVDEGQQRAGRFIAACPDTDIPGQAGGEINTVRLCLQGAEQAHVDHRTSSQQGVQFLRIQEQPGRLQHRTLAVMAARLVAFRELFPELRAGPLCAIQHQYAAVPGQVVKDGRRLLQEQRQVVFDTGRRDPLADVAIHAARLRVALEHGTETSPEQPDRGFIHGKLACRQQADAVLRIQRALGLRVKGADAVDLVIQQIDAERFTGTHGVEIEQCAAHRELTMLHDLCYATVSGVIQALAHFIQLEPLTGPDDQAVAADKFGWRQPLQQGGCGNHQQAALQPGQAIECRQAFGHDVLVRREGIVGQRLPVREYRRRQPVRAREEGNLFLQQLRRLHVGRDDHQRAALLHAGRTGNGERQAVTAQSIPAVAAGSRRQRRGQRIGHDGCGRGCGPCRGHACSGGLSM